MSNKPTIAFKQDPADAGEVAKATKPNIGLKTEGDSIKPRNPMDEVLERLERVERENASMKSQLASQDDNSFTKRREKYTGPNWKYSYKTWEGKPIVGFKTLEMKLDRDFTKWGKYITTQIVELTLADGSTKKMDYDIFAQGYGTSEKIFVEAIRTSKGVKYYEFNVDGETFEVADNIIN